MGDKAIIIQTLILASITLTTFAWSKWDYSKLSARLDKLSERFFDLSARFDQLTERVSHISVRLDQLTERVDKLTERVSHISARVFDLSGHVGKLTVRVDKLTERVSHISARVFDLSGHVGKLTVRVDKLTERVSHISARVFDLSGHVGKLSNLVGQTVGFVQGKADQPFVPIDLQNVNTGETQSPATINTKGKAIADELKVYQLVEKYHNRVLVPEDANEYHIQNLCFTFVLTTMFQVITQEEREVIEKKIYEDSGNTDNTLYVYAILFRDFYLKKNGFAVPKYALD